MSGFGTDGRFCRVRKRHTQRFRRVVSTCSEPSAAVYEKAFCREARWKCSGFGIGVLPQFSNARSIELASAALLSGNESV